MKNVLAWLRRNSDKVEYITCNSFCGTYMGRKIRFNDGILQVGNKEFDRWANSVAYSTPLNDSDNIRIVVNDALTEASKDKRTPWERSIDVMLDINSR